MCERTKQEVLARELAYQRALGMSIEARKYSENNWVNFIVISKNILKSLDKHGT